MRTRYRGNFALAFIDISIPTPTLLNPATSVKSALTSLIPHSAPYIGGDAEGYQSPAISTTAHCIFLFDIRRWTALLQHNLLRVTCILRVFALHTLDRASHVSPHEFLHTNPSRLLAFPLLITSGSLPLPPRGTLVFPTNPCIQTFTSFWPSHTYPIYVPDSHTFFACLTCVPCMPGLYPSCTRSGTSVPAYPRNSL